MPARYVRSIALFSSPSFLFSFLVAVVSPSPTANAQAPVVLPRLMGPVELDGFSHEPAWRSIEPLPVIMHEPTYGAEPSRPTEVRVAYDDAYLYVAGRLYDDRGGPQGPSLKRDVMKLNNDYFGIVLDTFNDNENALTFWVTPSGIRLDYTLANDGEGENSFNSNWDTFWDAEVAQTDEGWFAEIRIPFTSLRFQDEAGQVAMGLTVGRYIARLNEWHTYPAVPPRGASSPLEPSQAQDVILQDIHSRRPLYVTPYLLGGITKEAALDAAGTAYHHIKDPTYDVGLDVKYGITSNLTLDLTVNTDFAQVEADDQQVNLTQFSLFLPEKRRFFQERSGVFAFNTGGPTRVFYSRRIGLYEGQPVPILGGARLVGRVGRWDVGILDMQTARIPDFQHAGGKGLPSENFGVVRLRRRVLNPFSYAGGIVTSRVGEDGSHNVTYGLDGIFRLFGDDYLKLVWAQTFEDGEAADPVSLGNGRIQINWARRAVEGLNYSIDLARSGAHYNPGIGFETPHDYHRVGGALRYGWLPGEGAALQNHSISFGGQAFRRNLDGSFILAQLYPSWTGQLRSGHSFRAQLSASHEDLLAPFSLGKGATVPAGGYTYYAVDLEYGMPSGDLLRSDFSFHAGSFYDGRRLSATVEPTWSTSRYLELSSAYEYNRILFPARDERLDVHIGRLRLQATFSPKISLAAFVQYNSAVDAAGLNCRLRYNPREGNDLYLVFNEGINMDRYRLSPALPVTSQRTAVLKYSYTFLR